MDDNCTTGEGEPFLRWGPMFGNSYTHKNSSINLSVGAKKGQTLKRMFFKGAVSLKPNNLCYFPHFYL